VSDSGIGIRQENLHPIFVQGFSRPADKHGAGLHRNALAAKNLEGDLTVSSPGEDQGATFALTLPITFFKIPA